MIKKVLPMKMAATASYRAVPSILIVAPTKRAKRNERTVNAKTYRAMWEEWDSCSLTWQNESRHAFVNSNFVLQTSKGDWQSGSTVKRNFHWWLCSSDTLSSRFWLSRIGQCVRRVKDSYSTSEQARHKILLKSKKAPSVYFRLQYQVSSRRPAYHTSHS